MCPPTNIGNLAMNVCVYAYVHLRCVVIQGRAQGGGDFDLVAPLDGGMERKNPMGTNMRKNPISDNL